MGQQLDRYSPGGHLTVDEDVNRVIAEVTRASGRPPVVVTVHHQGRDQSGLIFVLFMGLLFVMVIAIAAVSCHATPIIHETHSNPSCKVGCF